MRKIFSLVIIIVAMVSCQKKSVEPISAPVANVAMTLTDSTEAELLNSSFTIVFDKLFGNENAVSGYSVTSNRRMYDTWSIDANGSCTVTPYFYDCPSTYTYSASNFPYTPILYVAPVVFHIAIHGDTIDLPSNNPLSWRRVGGSSLGIISVLYKRNDPSGIGSRSFQLNDSVSNFNLYSIK